MKLSRLKRNSRSVGLSGAAIGVLLAGAGAGAPAAAQSGGNGTIYMGAYDESIWVIDEQTLEVSGKIQMQTGIPTRFRLSHNRERLYLRDATTHNVEVVDLASQRSIDNFTLSHGDVTVRINGLEVDPEERFAILLVKSYTKLIDRYEIGPSILLRYDLQAHAVTDTIPWPDGEERDFARILFSPAGDLVYFFTDEILVLETDGFTEVDRWEYAEALEDGMGRFSFGFPTNLYEEPGFYTGMFRVTDPVQNRRMMGVARVNLAERDIDFYLLGPSASVSFVMAPDGKKAYGLHSEVGNYEFWTFDLEERRVVGKTQFDGRSRMALMPSSNGELLYIYNAGNSIDVYDAETFRHLRTVQYDADMTSMFLMPAAGGR